VEIAQQGSTVASLISEQPYSFKMPDRLSK
jgi:hypothetical protein